MDAKQQINKLMQTGHPDEAKKVCMQLIDDSERMDSEALMLMASIQAQLGNLDQVCQYCLHALEIKPNSADAYYNMAVAQQKLGNASLAITYYRKTIELQPAHLGAHINLGVIFREEDMLPDATKHLLTASRLQPGNSSLHYQLGNMYRTSGDLENSEKNFRKAISLSNNDPRILNNLGSLLFSTGRVDEATSIFYQAMEIEPDSHVIHYNLSIALWRLNRISEALPHCLQAIKLSTNTRPARQSLVQLVSESRPDSLPETVWAEIPRTFEHKAIDCQPLVPHVIYKLKLNPLFSELSRHSHAPATGDFIGRLLSGYYSPLLNSTLLLATLPNSVILDREFESILSLIRQAFLEILAESTQTESVVVNSGHITFLAALANQCFLNEYVYSTTPDEHQSLQRLTSKLDSALCDNQSTDNQLLAILLLFASYQPLHTLTPDTCSRIRNIPSLPSHTRDVITRQIDEPAKELLLEKRIIEVSGITDTTSVVVRKQYEESPYPRWVNVNIHDPRKYNEVLGEIFPQENLPAFDGSPLKILIAGCGTGQHALQTATRFKDSHITAIDLSKSSLAYAVRKTREYDIRNIDFYQADILELGELDQYFHIIESVGVLHHMKEPATGLSMLSDKLVPGGLMNIGLYSTCARRNITRARGYLKRAGLESSPEDIRASRQMIFQLDSSEPASEVQYLADFYSLSECRDLLFHVQEHTFSLSEINSLINKEGLRFLGFEFTRSSTLHQYRNLYPDDVKCTNLNNWQSFENKYKDTFIGMYTFWCQNGKEY